MESREDIEQTAGAWVVKRGQDTWTPADEAELQEWLAQSSGHRVAFYRLNAGWQEAGRLKALGAGATPAEELKPSINKFTRWRVPSALAAGVLLAILVGLTIYLRAPADSYRTPVGGFAAVPLADGSKVTLNTDSKVRIAMSEHERRIELQRGEAFFEVAKDVNRPFVVVAGERRVVAVGTRFSVMRGANDDVRVVVTEGVVRIENGSDNGREPKMQLAAGSIARAGNDGVIVEQKALPVTEEYLSWRSGFVVFHETPLADIAAEFNRYNTRQIVIEDADVAALHFGGNFRSDNIEGFLRLLQQSFPVEVREDGARIIVTQRDNSTH